MKKIIYSLFLIIFILLPSSLFSCQDDTNKAKEIVSDYLKDQFAVRIGNYYSVQDYFHPDLAFPPGEIQYLHVVDSKFSIVDVQKKIMNINLMEPKDEEITIVSVLFKRYCDIYNNEFIPAGEEYTRNYYLSKSTGKLLILDYDDPPEKAVTLKIAIQWVSGMKDKSKKWSELYTKVVALQKEEQAKQADK